MKTTYLTVSAALIALLVTAPAALALPPVDDDDPIPHCPPGYILVDEICVKRPTPPPPPPSNSPVPKIELARQTTDAQAVRVTGRATDADQPGAALTVHISVDGVHKRTVVANLADPPVATPGAAKIILPPTPGGHGFDATVPAAADAKNVCITAVNVGSTGTNKTTCKDIDNVLEFSANSLDYNVALAKLKDAKLVELDRVDHTNATSVQQSTSIAGSKTTTDTHTWTKSGGVKVTVKTKVGIPFIGESEVTVEGSFNYTDTETVTTTKVFSWSQPVIVPARKRVVGTVSITETKLEVPYTVVGDYVYDTGFRVAGRVNGTYQGTDGHDLQVRLQEFNLDGSPSARPAPQPQAKLLQGT